MDLKRPCCHEAGHAVVALFFGFRVDGIKVFGGRFHTMCQLDAKDRTDKERFIFLAGGIAGEKSSLGNYDSGGYNDDQKKISERGGESIEVYLADATRIIDSNKESFREIVKKITTRAIERSMEMSISGGKNSFKLVTGAEIQQVWTVCQSRQLQQGGLRPGQPE
jgi:hypothetical protein